MSSRAGQQQQQQPGSSQSATRGNDSGGAGDSNNGRRFAFVTLLTTDEYLPGALVLAHSLRRTHNVALQPPGTLTPADVANLGSGAISTPSASSSNSVELVCLVTPSTVSVRSIRALVRAFDKVVGVEPLSFSGFAATSVRGSRDRSRAREIRQESQRKLALLGESALCSSFACNLHTTLLAHLFTWSFLSLITTTTCK